MTLATPKVVVHFNKSLAMTKIHAQAMHAVKMETDVFIHPCRATCVCIQLSRVTTQILASHKVATLTLANAKYTKCSARTEIYVLLTYVKWLVGKLCALLNTWNVYLKISVSSHRVHPKMALAYPKTWTAMMEILVLSIVVKMELACTSKRIATMATRVLPIHAILRSDVKMIQLFVTMVQNVQEIPVIPQQVIAHSFLSFCPIPIYAQMYFAIPL